MADSQKFVQMQPKQLAGAGAAIGATSIIIQDFTTIDGVPLTMDDFGSKGWATLEPGNIAQEEQISFTGITQNANGTATLTGVKSVAFIYPYTETTGLIKSHAGSTIFIISNTAAFYDSLTSKTNDELISGIWTFVNPSVPRMDAAPSYGAGTELYFATKQYVDGVALAGAPNASTTQKGILEEATQAEIDADTPTGGTGARLAITPPNLATSKYGIRLPSANEKSALGGSSGAVGSTNKYITQDDVTVDGAGVTQSAQNGTGPVGEADLTTRANKLWQTFIAENTSLVGIYLHKLANTGTNAGDVIVALYAVDGSNNPTGSALATVTVTAATYNALPLGLNLFTFASPYTMTIGTSYGFQISQSTADTSNHANFGYQTTNVYANGLLKKFNTPDGWTLVTGDLTFILVGTTNSKIVRRKSDGQVPVPSAPSASTDAASKGFVESIVGEKIAIAYTDVTVANTTTETNLVSQTITGGTLSTNNGIRVRLNISSWQRTSGTVVFRFKYGATTLIATASLTLANVTAGIIEFFLLATGSASSQEGTSRIHLYAESTSSANNAYDFLQTSVGTSAIDSASNQTLAITVQFNTADPSNAITVANAIIEKIR